MSFLNRKLFGIQHFCNLADPILLMCATLQIQLLYPEPGHVEIQADHLWSTIVSVIKEAIAGNWDNYISFHLF